MLGFSRRSILASFLIESVLLSLAGGLLGVLMVLPLNGITTGIGNFVTFSEIAFKFHIGFRTAAMGLAFSAILGVLGGLLPTDGLAKGDSGGPPGNLRDPDHHERGIEGPEDRPIETDCGRLVQARQAVDCGRSGTASCSWPHSVSDTAGCTRRPK